MQGKLSITLTVAFAVALAGCAEKKDTTDDGMDDAPPGTGGDAYTVTTSGVPAQADAGENFTVTVRVAGPPGTTDHVGAHYGLNVSAAPTTALYNFPCLHQD